MNEQAKKMTAQEHYLKACEILGKTPRPVLEDRSDKDEVSIDAYARLIVCIHARNMVKGKEWERKYDGTQLGYTPRWVKNKSGFGLSGAIYDLWITFTFVGSRLEYRSYDLMIKGVTELDEFYQDLLTA